jgi:hypothetical protein
VSPGDVSDLYRQLDDARAALPALPPEDRKHIAAAIDKTEAAIRHLADVASRGQNRQAIDDFLRAVVAIALANSPAGIVADDVVAAALVGLAWIATRLVTEAPAPPAELARAWEAVRTGLNDVAVATRDAVRAHATTTIPPWDDCTAHLSACLGTRLGKRHSGGKSKHSICRDCFDICHGPLSSGWPLRTGDGKDCQWWNHL